MADRQCVTCGKDVYQSITEADTRWYHREGSTTLCYPKVYAKPDHLFVEGFPGPLMSYLSPQYIEHLNTPKYFGTIVHPEVKRDLLRLEGLEDHYKEHTHAAHPDLLRRVENLEAKRSAEFMTLESRLEDAENRVMELEGQEPPVFNMPRTAATVLRLAQKVDDLEAKLAEYAAFPPTMISPGPTALEILRIDSRIEENTERLRSQSLAMGRLTNRTDNAWTAINQHRRLSNPHGK